MDWSESQCKVTYNGKDTALGSDASLAAGSVELFEGLRCVGGCRRLSVNLIIYNMELPHTVLAADGGEIEDVKLAALSGSATAESRVGLGQGDGSAGGEGEDGGGELHDDCGLRVVGCRG